MKKLFVASACISLTVLFTCPLADTGQDPPVVTIYEVLNGTEIVDVEELEVIQNSAFTLLGVATGNAPLYFYWYKEVDPSPQLIGVGQLLDLNFSEAGIVRIFLEVVDVNGLSGHDSLTVRVIEPTVPIESSTLGKIKSKAIK